MSSIDQYSACFNRFAFHLDKTVKYVSKVFPKIENTNDMMQFGLENILIRISSFLEEFLGCIILIATGRNEKLVRNYFQVNGSDQVKQDIKKGCNLGTLVKHSKSEISFKDEAKKIERIFNHLYSMSPFPDKNTKDMILDMVLVRNIIIHEGGWPNEHHQKQIRNSGAIKISRKINLPRREVSFYKLEFTDKKFVYNALNSVKSLMGSEIIFPPTLFCYFLL